MARVVTLAIGLVVLAALAMVQTTILLFGAAQLARVGDLSIAGASHQLAALTRGQASRSWIREHRDYVRQATVDVLEPSCTGFVADAPHRIVTAAHCVPEGETRLSVRTANGQRHVATVRAFDRDADWALLTVDKPLSVTPLTLSTQVPQRGDSLLFVARTARKDRVQVAKVERLGRCPTLPKMSDAVFTSVHARPGDSGSPILNRELKVVALVHGGARCHIAAPVAPLARELEQQKQVPCKSNDALLRDEPTPTQ